MGKRELDEIKVSSSRFPTYSNFSIACERQRSKKFSVSSIYVIKAAIDRRKDGESRGDKKMLDKWNVGLHAVPTLSFFPFLFPFLFLLSLPAVLLAECSPSFIP